MKPFIYLLTACFSLILSNQLTAQDVPELQELPEVQAKPDKGDTYRLRAEDIVSLSVFKEPDLSKDATISESGLASFELIGSVKIGGLTVGESLAQIRDLYGQDYLRNPEMTLTVSQYAPTNISVIGQVRSPGTVSIPHGETMDVGTALESAGGITDSADPSNIRLIPAEGESIVLSHKEIQGDRGRIPLNAGDRIIVHESAHARSSYIVLGEVRAPGTFPLPQHGQLNLATALATAGGASAYADDASVKGVKLTKANGGTTTYSLKDINGRGAGQVAISGGDTIMVARNRFANTTVTVMGEVNAKGPIPFPLDGRLDIMNAIALARGFTDLANPKRMKITRGGKEFNINTKDLSAYKDGKVWLWPDDIIEVAESPF